MFTRCSIVAVTVLGMLWGTPANSQQAQQAAHDDSLGRYRFRASVDMVSLLLMATEPETPLLTNLTKEDFAAYENGIEQEIEMFSREYLPLRMTILLDTSASMIPKMQVAQKAAIRFVRSLMPEDRVKVLEFNDRVLTLVDFTSDFDRVADAIRHISPQGNTSLYNSLYVSLRDLAGDREANVRRVIVLLSDGADTHSLVSFDDVRELARKTGAVIYSACLFDSSQDPERDELVEVNYELRKLAVDTGGSAFLVEEVGDLAGVYDRIATELRSQYHLGYVSTNGDADGTWRRIQVFSTRTNVEMRTRSGYYTRKAPRSARVGTR